MNELRKACKQCNKVFELRYFEEEFCCHTCYDTWLDNKINKDFCKARALDALEERINKDQPSSSMLVIIRSVADFDLIYEAGSKETLLNAIERLLMKKEGNE